MKAAGWVVFCAGAMLWSFFVQPALTARDPVLLALGLPGVVIAGVLFGFAWWLFVSHWFRKEPDGPEVAALVAEVEHVKWELGLLRKVIDANGAYEMRNLEMVGGALEALRQRIEHIEERAG